MWDSFVIVEECCPEKGGLSHFVAVGEPRVVVNGELGLKIMIMMADPSHSGRRIVLFAL